MPFIKISTLPNKLETANIMRKLEKAIYDYTSVPQNMATCIWNTHDCVVHNDQSYGVFDHTLEEIPVFVDLYLNSTFEQNEIAEIMTVIADELSKSTKVGRKWVFIHTHIGTPGHIFINGEVWND